MIAQPATLLDGLPEPTQEFYRHTIRTLDRAGVPFLVGGAYALAQYTGIVRHTKDFDIFCRADDCPRALEAMAAEGCRTELTFAHWLGKVFSGDDFVDVIFSSGNGVAKVDEEWFAHARPATFLGEAVRLCPAEEIIWSKAFICERERYDGGDINHLIKARGPEMDWQRLLRRFGPHWRVLLSHLVLFGFVYPGERDRVPGWVMERLLARLAGEMKAAPKPRKVCQGSLLSRLQYVIDLEEWGYADARLDNESGMSMEEATEWTDAGVRQEAEKWK